MVRRNRRPPAGISTRSVLVSLAALGALALTGAPSRSAVSARADGPAAPDSAPRLAALPHLRQQAQDEGTVRVIVELDASFTPEGELRTDSQVEEQQEEIEQAQEDLIESLPLAEGEVASAETFESIPYVVVEVDAAGLEALADNPAVAGIQEDVPSPPLLAESIRIIGADEAWAVGYTGAGQVVAILDTGVDKTHDFLSGKVVGEACFSTTAPANGSTSLCPSPDASGDQVGEGSGVNCPIGISGCEHGTHVAGIAVGKGTASGVAKDASLIAIQVFSRFDGTQCSTFGMSSPCVLSWTSDQLAALDWLYSQKDSYNLAAANLSLGGGLFSGACDSDSRKAAIDNLRSVGTATVVAAGNSGSRTSLSSPACISSVVSVGATDDDDAVASFSNVAPFLSLLAPGTSIISSVPNNAFQTMSGTSMATPHVAGAFAVLKAIKPDATVDELLNALDTTGKPVSADGSAALTFSRIALKAAADALVPPVTSSFEDVPITHWAYPYIEALYQNGFVVGCSATPRLYCPQNILNRAESAVFVERGAHGALSDPPYAPPPTATFTDVPSSFWGHGWIESLWTDGFTAGCSTSPPAYCPTQQHTRAEGSVFFLRIKNGSSYTPPTPADIFDDVAPTDWYAGWVEAAYNQGLLPACSESPLNFCPEGALDRSWAAYMMVQAKGGLGALGAGTP